MEKLTDGPVGVGTRYRARWANSGPTAVEVVQFDRPHSWETTATARGMSIRFQGTVTDTGPGAHYSASLKLHPRGLAWLVAPLALLAMRRQDQQNMDRIREALESNTIRSTYDIGMHPTCSASAAAVTCDRTGGATWCSSAPTRRASAG